MHYMLSCLLSGLLFFLQSFVVSFLEFAPEFHQPVLFGQRDGVLCLERSPLHVILDLILRLWDVLIGGAFRFQRPIVLGRIIHLLGF